MSENTYIPTDDEVVEWLDPDWRDHFTDTDQAAEHYRRWAHEQWTQALKELA